MCCFPVKLLWYQILMYVTLCMQCLRNSGRLACCAHYVGSQRSQLTFMGVFGGGDHSQEGSWVSPSQGGRGYSVFMPKCTHQTHKSRVCNIYVWALRPCVSEVWLCLCCYGEGWGLSNTLTITNDGLFDHPRVEVWHTHISLCHPFGVFSKESSITGCKFKVVNIGVCTPPI